MPSLWDLNAIALAHRQRFFAALHEALDDLSRDRAAQAAVWPTVVGNLLWVRAGFDEQQPALQREASATAGALLGTLGPELLAATSDDPLAAARALAQEQEQALLQHWDLWLARLQRDLCPPGRPEPSPSSLNEGVWRTLFPNAPYELGFGALVRQLQASLLASEQHRA